VIIFEKVLFNIIAVSMFILMFFKMIRKNDTTYIYILFLQVIGIIMNFLELIFNIFTRFWF